MERHATKTVNKTSSCDLVDCIHCAKTLVTGLVLDVQNQSTSCNYLSQEHFAQDHVGEDGVGLLCPAAVWTLHAGRSYLCQLTFKGLLTGTQQNGSDLHKFSGDTQLCRSTAPAYFGILVRQSSLSSMSKLA